MVRSDSLSFVSFYWRGLRALKAVQCRIHRRDGVVYVVKLKSGRSQLEYQVT